MKLSTKDIKRLNRYQAIIKLCTEHKSRYELADILDNGVEAVYIACKYLVDRGFMECKEIAGKNKVNGHHVYKSLIAEYPVHDFVTTAEKLAETLLALGKTRGGDNTKSSEERKLSREKHPLATLHTMESLAENIKLQSRQMRSEYKSPKNYASSNSMAMF